MNPLHPVETGRTPDHLAGDMLTDHYWSVGLPSLSSARRSVVTPSTEAQPSCPLSRIAVLKALRPPQATLRSLGRLAITLGLLIIVDRTNADAGITISSLDLGVGSFSRQITKCELLRNNLGNLFVDDLRVGRTSFHVRPEPILTSISGAPNGVVSLSGAGVPTTHHLIPALNSKPVEREITDVSMTRS